MIFWGDITLKIKTWTHQSHRSIFQMWVLCFWSCLQTYECKCGYLWSGIRSPTGHFCHIFFQSWSIKRDYFIHRHLLMLHRKWFSLLFLGQCSEVVVHCLCLLLLYLLKFKTDWISVDPWVKYIFIHFTPKLLSSNPCFYSNLHTKKT